VNNQGQVGIILFTTRDWTRHTWKYERVTHLRCWYEHVQTLSTGVSSGRSVSNCLTSGYRYLWQEVLRNHGIRCAASRFPSECVDMRITDMDQV
jgi:hypothetical protein